MKNSTLLLQGQSLRAALERQRRSKARARLLPFCDYNFGGYSSPGHIKAIAEKLEAVDRGEITRLMIFLPPRHGKSQLSSIFFPAWYLGRHPNRKVIAASYNSELATDFGRQVRNTVDSEEYQRIFPKVKLSPDSKSAGRWNTHTGGAYIAAGVGTAITGRGADIALIDDPVKDRQEAESEIVRKRVWDWYRSTFYTRLMPGGSIILIMTRWHSDDLAGRLLAEQESGDKWQVLNLPAIDDDGKALWPEWFPIGRLASIKSAIGSRDWEALYQQRPVPPGGNLFKRIWFDVVDHSPADFLSCCRAWDCAGTEGGGDYTVGAKVTRSKEGIWYIDDVVRGQWSPHEVERVIAQTAQMDGTRVRIRIEQEPGSSGKFVVHEFVRRLAGYDVKGIPCTGEKSLRWRPLAAQAEAGNVRLVRGPWINDFLDEITTVPNAKHDDQADAASLGLNELSARTGGMVRMAGF